MNNDKSTNNINAVINFLPQCNFDSQYYIDHNKDIISQYTLQTAYKHWYNY